MTLAEFDKIAQRSAAMRTKAHALMVDASLLEEQALADAGIEYVNREAGFSCWRSVTGGPWCNNPREVLKQREA